MSKVREQYRRTVQTLGGGGTAPGEGLLARDAVFDMLSNPRRRYVLYYLRHESGPVQLTSLAERVAAAENETDVESLEDRDRKRVYVSLYQTHVPKLSDAGLVEYDKEAGTVALTDDARIIDQYISRPRPERGVSWPLVYLTEVMIGGLALVATVSAFSQVPQMYVSLLTLILFGCTNLVHVLCLHRRRNSPPELLLKQ
jgi:hypothetical protein